MRAVIVAAVVFVSVAVTLGVIGVVVRVDASQARSKNDRLVEQLRKLESTERAQAGQLRRWVGAAGEVTSSNDGFLAAVRAQVGSSNHVVVVANHAADLFNAGQKADAIAALQGDATVAVGDLETKTNAVRDACGGVQRAVANLKQAAGG